MRPTIQSIVAAALLAAASAGALGCPPGKSADQSTAKDSMKTPTTRSTADDSMKTPSRSTANDSMKTTPKNR